MDFPLTDLNLSEFAADCKGEVVMRWSKSTTMEGGEGDNGGWVGVGGRLVG